MLKNYLLKGRLEAGCDEAGRGCLAGPVFAAAVIWPEKLEIKEIDDSKKLNPQKREELRRVIEENAIAYSIAQISPEEIDRINILQASFAAMHQALDQMKIKAEHLLIDGNRFKDYPGIDHTCIIGGDGKYTSIAAASILAKCYRDAYMLQIHTDYPVFAWNSNKGYATQKHRDAIKKHGLTAHHRRTFCKNVLALSSQV